MKPEDIKFPFIRKEKKVLIQERIWHVPEQCEGDGAFTFPGWHSEQIFANNHPIFIEYCSGNGAWIADKAAASAQQNWVAVEKRFVRARKIASKVHNKQLKNLLTVCAEAYQVTKLYLPTDSVEGVFVNFPDPWPKRRHARHRLIQPAFLDELHRILKKEGSVTIATDDADYSERAIKEFEKHAGFVSKFPKPYYINEWQGYGSSFFEELWRQKGREIRYHSFVRRG